MIAGDITLAVADVDLVYVSLRALISSVATAEDKQLLPRIGMPCDRAVRDHRRPGPPPPATAARLRAVPPAPRGRLRTGRGARVTPDPLWRHEEVVEALMEDRDLLPVRFGTRLDDEEAAARAVAGAARELTRALDRVRGAVELSVRVVTPGDRRASRPRAESGASICARGRGSRRARETAASASRAARRARACETPGGRRAAASCFAPRTSSSATALPVRGRVARLQRAAAARLLCTGPWPPYSFASA